MKCRKSIASIFMSNLSSFFYCLIIINESYILEKDKGWEIFDVINTLFCLACPFAMNYVFDCPHGLAFPDQLALQLTNA